VRIRVVGVVMYLEVVCYVPAVAKRGGGGGRADELVKKRKGVWASVAQE